KGRLPRPPTSPRCCRTACAPWSRPSSARGPRSWSWRRTAPTSSAPRTDVLISPTKELDERATHLQHCKSFSLTYLAESAAAAILDSCPDVAATAPARYGASCCDSELRASRSPPASLPRLRRT